MQQDENYPAGHQGSAAQKIASNPVKAGGASFGTHKLVEVSPNRMEFKPAFGAVLFYLIFMVSGIGVFIFFLHNFLSGKCSLFTADVFIPFLVGTGFTIVGGCMLYFGTVPIVFDKNNGYFWKGRKSPDAVFNIDQIKSCAQLNDINAIQIISEYCSGRKSSYMSYEINLVLKNGNRTNVVDHGNLKQIRTDAEKLSAFLGKPVLDLMQR
jgi:hypothetical protein